MKKLVGGDYLLDLTPIVIEQSDDGNYTNITNAEVLEQLTNLKKYVKNPSMVKPVWVKMKNGETDELIVARGTFAVVDAGEFEICIIVDGYKLKLHIEFTQAELEDHTPIDDWYIDTNDAKFIFTSDYKRVVVEDVKNIDDNVLSTLQCGDVVIKHDESGEHAYIVTFRSETGICLTYTDASCVETQSYDYVDGTGWVYNSQDLSFINRMEQIVDADGHNRFIENDFKQDTITGVNTIYGKWSLSGTHIMFVFAGKIDNATALSSGRLGYFLDIPDWVLSKIYPVVTNVLEVKNIQAYNENYGSAQTISLSLRKVNNKMELHCSSFTATDDRYFRAQFDLLIDNEQL